MLPLFCQIQLAGPSAYNISVSTVHEIDAGHCEKCRLEPHMLENGRNMKVKLQKVICGDLGGSIAILELQRASDALDLDAWFHQLSDGVDQTVMWGADRRSP